MRRPSCWFSVIVGAGLIACGGTPRQIPPERTVYLPIPVNAEAESPLSYVVKANSAVDHAAPFVTGKSVSQAANADISEVVAASDKFRVSGGIDQIRIAAGTDEVTHIVIDAVVERVDVIRDIKYNGKSKCCDEEGLPTDSCVGGYIESVMVGTGTVSYAKLKDGDAAPAKPDAMVGRSELRTLKTRPFAQSFFAFTAASAERACEFSQK